MRCLKGTRRTTTFLASWLRVRLFRADITGQESRGLPSFTWTHRQIGRAFGASGAWKWLTQRGQRTRAQRETPTAASSASPGAISRLFDDRVIGDKSDPDRTLEPGVVRRSEL